MWNFQDAQQNKLTFEVQINFDSVIIELLEVKVCLILFIAYALIGRQAGPRLNLLWILQLWRSTTVDQDAFEHIRLCVRK